MFKKNNVARGPRPRVSSGLSGGTCAHSRQDSSVCQRPTLPRNPSFPSQGANRGGCTHLVRVEIREAQRAVPLVQSASTDPDFPRHKREGGPSSGGIAAKTEREKKKKRAKSVPCAPTLLHVTKTSAVDICGIFLLAGTFQNRQGPPASLGASVGFGATHRRWDVGFRGPRLPWVPPTTIFAAAVLFLTFFFFYSGRRECRPWRTGFLPPERISKAIGGGMKRMCGSSQ
ncbi:hypothetical protein BDZ88DRAFT_205000 [Geranomyces variabilis]|nr:hypothetical protein BDZ88DRAFT_205000 [Geranomyces variabilis]